MNFSLCYSYSTGVGRTGTLIAIQSMMKMIEREKKVDIFSFVLNVRHQRNFMVQTEVKLWGQSRHFVTNFSPVASAFSNRKALSYIATIVEGNYPHILFLYSVSTCLFMMRCWRFCELDTLMYSFRTSLYGISCWWGLTQTLRSLEWRRNLT